MSLCQQNHVPCNIEEYFHTYRTSHNNPAGLQPKMKDASSLIFSNFYFFFLQTAVHVLPFSQVFDVFFHGAMILLSDSILYS